MSDMTRRRFTKAMAVTGAAVAFGNLRVQGANSKIRLGFIGLGNRGDQVLDAFLLQPDSEVAAICDLYQPYLDFAAAKIGGSPKRFDDYRKLLELKDLDAVVINTPDHWHALQTVHACQAGKDVYVEKPLSLCVAEGRRMVRAVLENKRVCQVGIHRRSLPSCREAADLVRQGAIGQVTAVRAFHVQNEWPKGIGSPPDTEPPPGVDWDRWLGPAPAKPYNKNRTFYRFRWFYDYSGGQVTNFGVHYIDFVHMALGVSAPLAVTALGGKFAVEDNREIPDTLEALWHYQAPSAGQSQRRNVLVTFSQFNASAAPVSARGADLEIRGTKGTLYLLGNNYEIVPEKITENEFPARSPLTRQQDSQYRKNDKTLVEPRKGASSERNDTALHARNFLDCIKSRAQCNCDIESAHRSTSATLIANIALKTQNLLLWDAEKEQFTNHAAANRYLDYAYRPGYRG